MNLKSVKEISPNSKVILRIDADLPIENGQVLDNSRLMKSISTINLLLEKQCKIAIIGHRGRPQGFEENLSLKPVYVELMALLEDGQNLIESVFIEDITNGEKIKESLKTNNIIFFENLRFWPGEEENNRDFLQSLIDQCDFFVNDAFAVAHRKHASIRLFEIMPTYYGLSFVEETEKIEKIISNPQKPITVVLGGAKEDKLKYLPGLLEIADWVLIGGKLPKLVESSSSYQVESSKIVMAKLNKSRLDLSDEDIKNFEEIIAKSKTIIWAGALGFYESEENRKGTNEIAKAIAESDSYKIIAGGDTSASIVNLGLKDKIDFICSGGGVMLEFLTKRKLTAWEN